jgi:hypothetical protein
MMNEEKSNALQAHKSFLTPPMVSNTENDVLDYNKLSHSPTVTVMPWIGMNSNSKLWLHCECTLADGKKGIIKLAEAATFKPDSNSTAFTCDLPLNELSKLGDNTDLTLILMVSSDGSLDEQKLSSIRYSLMFQHPVLISNPRSWMTDIGSNLDCLKVHDLVMPMAHNAGMDMKNATWPASQWAACQDDTFVYQLNNGIRAFDLRLYKHEGSLQFMHSGYHTWRTLSDCTSMTRHFAIQNPGEIVILGFHVFNVNDMQSEAMSIMEHDLGDICIPATAADMTIGQIRNRFPGRNVIIALDMPNWFCWPKVDQTWTGRDVNNVDQLAAHFREVMNNPPMSQLWSMFAAGYDMQGPIRIGSASYIWRELFDHMASGAHYRQPFKGNMMNVDFFAVTGVVDRCINATRDRAAIAKRASPNTLHASHITINSIHLSWQRPHDLESVTYDLYLNNKFIGNNLSNDFTFRELNGSTTYHLTVIPIFPSGRGAAAEITAMTADITPPSKPGDLHFIFVDGHPQAFLAWKASTDNIGVKEYQIYRGTEKIGAVNAGTQTYPINLTEIGKYFKVRAVDAAGNFTDSDPLLMHDGVAPSKPVNLRAINVTENFISLQWDPSHDNVKVDGYDVYRGDTVIAHVKSTTYVDNNVSNNTYIYKVRALDTSGNHADSDSLTVPPAFNGPIDLQFFRIEDSKGLITWKPPFNSNGVTGYRLSRNDNVAVELSATLHAFGDLKPGTTYVFEVRAIRNGQYSSPATVTG